MRALKWLLLALFLWSAPVYAQPAPAKPDVAQAQLSQTLKNLEQTKQVDAALAARQQALRQELGSLQTRATSLAEQLQISERRVSAEEQALAKTTTRLSAKQREFEIRKADYASTILTLLRMRALPATALFANPDDTETLLRTAAVLEKTNQAVAIKARALRMDLTELKTLKSDAALRRSRTQAEAKALALEQGQLEHALTMRQKLQAQLAQDRARSEARIASLSQESESLQSLIGKLEADAREQAARSKTQPKPKPNRASLPSKGGMRAPVTGEIVHRFGDKKSANETYRGMVLRTRGGAAVVAPNDGDIVFTGPFRDYGNILLIKHSNGYISLIAGLGRITTSIGQSVLKGEPVAAMPSSASAEAYVELRDGSAKPIDPGDWFANVTKVAAQ